MKILLPYPLAHMCIVAAAAGAIRKGRKRIESSLLCPLLFVQKVTAAQAGHPVFLRKEQVRNFPIC